MSTKCHFYKVLRTIWRSELLLEMPGKSTGKQGNWPAIYAANRVEVYYLMLGASLNKVLHNWCTQVSKMVVSLSKIDQATLSDTPIDSPMNRADSLYPICLARHPKVKAHATGFLFIICFFEYQSLHRFSIVSMGRDDVTLSSEKLIDNCPLVTPRSVPAVWPQARLLN